MGRLDDLDLTLKLSRKEQDVRLEAGQARMQQLRLTLGGQTSASQHGKRDDPVEQEHPIGPPLLVVFEGWDASGKGGAIKRLTGAMDPRHYRVAEFAAPSPDELRHHWLHRFWLPLPGRGGMAVYDRTWYGRVLVERVEDLTPELDWRRGYQEIREFERQLTDDGTILVKFWLHISDEEQLSRFERRRDDPLKSWKLTAEDWRNREKREAYTEAVEEMVAETDSGHAPWNLIPGDSKRWARVAVLETVIRRVEERCEELGFALPEPLDP
ncbi:polyphosphate kinase 2 family protein [Patulibacter minatonensis]|uniref:polyphosphate kinase 2 family protein n=1 Tax=Patulibacter minatonensis TaxID=298163 RepID=UPI00047E1E7A|nr:UDP-galactose-lipid carrier transferase [Patulibacter minatonensis]